MQRRTVEKLVSGVLLLVACVLLAAGATWKHRVYDADSDDWGLVTFTRLSDKDLVIDATFGGVTRESGKLYSTYDRSQPRTKRACPT